MLIRPAALADLSACLALDANSQTDHVWQMEAREERDIVSIRFRTTRLPRTMHVTYPRQREDLVSCWEKGTTILVSTNETSGGRTTGQVDPREDEPVLVFGYCQLDVSLWQQAGWISHLIVERRLRHRGIGTAMLKASTAWGRKRGLEQLTVALQTKNYPAISFFEKHGFTFCGFNDRYFTNRDIALFFALRIRP